MREDLLDLIGDDEANGSDLAPKCGDCSRFDPCPGVCGHGICSLELTWRHEEDPACKEID